MTAKKLGRGPNGYDHPLIGRPCLYEGRPAIPFGSYECYKALDDGSFKDSKGLVIWFTEKNGKISVMTIGDTEELVPVDPQTFEGRQIVYKVHYGLLERVLGNDKNSN